MRKNKKLAPTPPDPNDFDIELRPFNPVVDTSFVYHTWLTQYRASPFAKDIDPTIFFHFHRRVVESCVKRFSTIIACNKTAPEHILGFINGAQYPAGPILLNFVHVRSVLRRQGLGRYMLEGLGWSPDSPMIATHWNRASRPLAERFAVGYNPYFLVPEFLEAPTHGQIKLQRSFNEWVAGRVADDRAMDHGREGELTALAPRGDGGKLSGDVDMLQAGHAMPDGSGVLPPQRDLCGEPREGGGSDAGRPGLAAGGVQPAVVPEPGEVSDDGWE